MNGIKTKNEKKKTKKIQTEKKKFFISSLFAHTTLFFSHSLIGVYCVCFFFFSLLHRLEPSYCFALKHMYIVYSILVTTTIYIHYTQSHWVSKCLPVMFRPSNTQRLENHKMCICALFLCVKFYICIPREPRTARTRRTPTTYWTILTQFYYFHHQANERRRKNINKFTMRWSVVICFKNEYTMTSFTVSIEHNTTIYLIFFPLFHRIPI